MKMKKHDLEVEEGSFARNSISAASDSASLLDGEREFLLTQLPRIRRIPLSLEQQRRWELCDCRVGVSTDHLTMIVKWEGEIVETLLRKALRVTIADHEILRTTIGMQKNEPYQVVWSRADWSHALGVVLPRGDQAVEDLLRYGSKISFDLKRGPLFQIVLVKNQIEASELIFSVHSMIADSTMLIKLASDLMGHYRHLEFQVIKNSGTAVVSSSSGILEDLACKPMVAPNQGCDDSTCLLDRDDGIPADGAEPSSRMEPACRGTYAFHLHRHRQALMRLAEEHQTTLSTVLMAAFMVTLIREIGQDELVVGTNRTTGPSDEINDPSMREMQTAIRLNVQCGMSFNKVLGRVRDSLNESRPGDGNPRFSNRTETTNSSDSPSPGFARFFLSFYPVEGYSTRGLDKQRVEIKSMMRHASCFDLHLNCFTSDHGLAGAFDYCPQTFQSNQVATIAERLGMLLDAVAEDTDCCLEDLQLTTERERRLLIEDLNDTSEEFDDECLQVLIEAQVARTPNAVAVRCGDTALTYKELNQHANQLAHYLRRKNISRGDTIGICLSASDQALIAILGTVKAGAAYVPMDVNYPIDRLQHMMDNAEMSAVLSLSEYTETTSCFSGIEVLNLDEADWLSRDEHTENPTINNEPDDLLYVVYTSGSTGLPKGAGVRHRNESNLLKWYVREYEMNGEDRTLVISSLGFDLTQKNLFALLTVGGCVVFPEERFYDPVNIRNEIQEHQITLINCAPSVFYPLQEREEDWRFLCSLRCVLFGGEPIQLPALRQWLRHSGCDLVNMYGPTECTDIAATYKLRQADDDATSLPIGRPNSNVRLYVVKPNSTTLVPFGVPGELCIGGAGVGIGYLNNHEQTKAAFFDNPFQVQDGCRGKLYRTGDLVKYREDGNLSFLGRLDNQVKIRGLRIELGEIEATLRRHPQVREAVVIASDDVSEERYLLGYVVAKNENKIEVRDLREHLASSLPGYMVPKHLINVAAMPLTPNGKIDRQGLLRIALSGRTLEREELAEKASGKVDDATIHAPGNNAIEAKLCRIWENLLKVRPVRVDDDFFELGGHSLLAVKMMSMVEKDFGRRFPLATLMRARTIAAFAEVLRREDSEPGWKSLVPIRPEESRIPLFLIHAAGGNLLVYDELAKHLGPDQPVYGFQSRGLDGKQLLHPTLEAMATAYRIEIQRFQPQGPYLLGGYCMGGTIALEIATQLIELGEEVAMVSLLDCHNWANVARPSIFGTLRYNWQKACFHLLNLFSLNAENRKRFLRGKIGELNRRKSVWYGNLQKKKNVGETELDQATALAAVWANNDRVATEYQPRTYPGKINQFLPKTNYSHLQDQDVGWTQIAEDGVDISYLPVYPAGMLMEPYVQQLAAEMLTLIKARTRVD